MERGPEWHSRAGWGRKGPCEGQGRAKKLGLGEYGQLLSRLGCGQACLSDKTFLAAARIRVQGSVGSGQLVRSGRGGVVEAKKDGFRESPCTGRVTLRVIPTGHSGAILREGTKRLSQLPSALQSPCHPTHLSFLLPILGSQCQASHQDVGDKSHSYGKQTHRHMSEEGPSGPPGT